MSIRNLSLFAVMALMAGPLATRSSALDSTSPDPSPDPAPAGFCQDQYVVTCKVLTATLTGQFCSTNGGRCCATKTYSFTCTSGDSGSITHYYAGQPFDVCVGYSCGNPYATPPTGPTQPVQM